MVDVAFSKNKIAGITAIYYFIEDRQCAARSKDQWRHNKYLLEAVYDRYFENIALLLYTHFKSTNRWLKTFFS